MGSYCQRDAGLRRHSTSIGAQALGFGSCCILEIHRRDHPGTYPELPPSPLCCLSLTLPVCQRQQCESGDECVQRADHSEAYDRDSGGQLAEVPEGRADRQGSGVGVIGSIGEGETKRDETRGSTRGHCLLAAAAAAAEASSYEGSVRCLGNRVQCAQRHGFQPHTNGVAPCTAQHTVHPTLPPPHGAVLCRLTWC